MKIYKTEIEKTIFVYEYDVPDEVIKEKFSNKSNFERKLNEEDEDVMDWLVYLHNEYDMELVKERQVDSDIEWEVGGN